MHSVFMRTRRSRHIPSGEHHQAKKTDNKKEIWQKTLCIEFWVVCVLDSQFCWQEDELNCDYWASPFPASEAQNTLILPLHIANVADTCCWNFRSKCLHTLYDPSSIYFHMPWYSCIPDYPCRQKLAHQDYIPIRSNGNEIWQINRPWHGSGNSSISISRLQCVAYGYFMKTLHGWNRTKTENSDLKNLIHEAMKKDKIRIGTERIQVVIRHSDSCPKKIKEKEDKEFDRDDPFAWCSLSAFAV